MSGKSISWLTANLTTYIYNSTDQSTEYLSIMQIGEDGLIIEQYKQTNTGDWFSTTYDDALFGQADDIGGALSSVAWTDAQGRTNRNMIYAVNGSMTEFWSVGGEWSSSIIFKD